MGRQIEKGGGTIQGTHYARGPTVLYGWKMVVFRTWVCTHVAFFLTFQPGVTVLVHKESFGTSAGTGAIVWVFWAVL